MTDTARDEHSQKNGALGNAGDHRGIPPSGMASHSAAVAGGAAVDTRSPSSVPPASATFGTTELRSNTELRTSEPRPASPQEPAAELPSSADLESGIHQTVNGALRATSEAPATVDLVLLSVTETFAVRESP